MFHHSAIRYRHFLINALAEPGLVLAGTRGEMRRRPA
jgi:hypothetical protein